jgi:hypothetical protein
MGLLASQYMENGTKLLDTKSEKRDAEKARIVEDLGRKKEEMITCYEDAKEFVQRAEKGAKSSSISHLEKEWHKEQEAIQKKIDEGRKATR